MDRSQAESEVLSAAVTRSWNSSAHYPCGTQRSLQVLGQEPELQPQSDRKERTGKVLCAGDRYVHTLALPLSHVLLKQTPLMEPRVGPLPTPCPSAGCSHCVCQPWWVKSIPGDEGPWKMLGKS